MSFATEAAAKGAEEEKIEERRWGVDNHGGLIGLAGVGDVILLLIPMSTCYNSWSSTVQYTPTN